MLLGHQRHDPVVRKALDHLQIEGKVAMITAGWQEREAQDQELRQEIGHSSTNLRIYERARDIFAKEPELFAAHRDKQDALKALQRMYGIRLESAMTALRRLRGLAPDDWGLQERQEQAAIAFVQALDAQHNEEVGKLWQTFHQEHPSHKYPHLMRHKEELLAELEDAQALLIAGGHVAILLNRLLLFEPGPWLLDRPLVAWSAGAMVLSSQIVLFHDSAAQGPNHAEIMGPGLGCYDQLIALPHASSRIRYEDKARTKLLADRFAPAVCAPLEPRMWLERDADGRWSSLHGTHLSPEGELAPWPTPQEG